MNWIKGSKKLGSDRKLSRIINEGDGKKLQKALTVLRDWRLNDEPILKMGGRVTKKTQTRIELSVWKKRSSRISL